MIGGILTKKTTVPAAALLRLACCSCRARPPAALHLSLPINAMHRRRQPLLSHPLLGRFPAHRPIFPIIPREPSVDIVAAHATHPRGGEEDAEAQEGSQTVHTQHQHHQHQQEDSNWMSVLGKWFRRLLTAAGIFFSITLAALALTPSFLSHPAGLRTALRAVNMVAAPLRAEIDSVDVKWNSPVEVHGVRVMANVDDTVDTKSGLSSGGDANRISVKPSRLDEEASPLSLSRSGSSGGGSGGGASKIVNQNNEKEKVGLERQLLSVDRIKTTATLWSLACGHSTDVLVSSPEVDVTLNAQGNLRVLQVLQDAGIAPLPRDRRPPSPPSSSSTLDTATKSTKLSSSAAAAAATITPLALQQIDSLIPFSGEIRAGSVHVALSSGHFLAPADFKEVLGECVHFEVLLGGEIIEEEAKNEEINAGFVDSTSADGEIEIDGMDGKQSLLAQWVREKPSKDEVPADIGDLISPVVLRLDSAAVKCKVEGWRTSAGYTYLTSPVEAELNLTPKLARALLSRLNPVLGDAVELRDTSRVAVSLTPMEMIWPSSALDFQLDPLRVRISQGSALNKGLQAMKLINQKIATAAASATLQVDFASPLRAKIEADGAITTRRLDILVSIPGLSSPLHLITWGTANLSPSGAVDMILAIPADSLAYLGLTGLPENFGVPIHVGGKVAAPTVNLIKASKDVALLVIEQKAKAVGPRSAEWMWQELKLGKERENFRIIPED